MNPPPEPESALRDSGPVRGNGEGGRAARRSPSEFRTSRNVHWTFRASRTAERLGVAPPFRRPTG